MDRAARSAGAPPPGIAVSSGLEACAGYWERRRRQVAGASSYTCITAGLCGSLRVTAQAQLNHSAGDLRSAVSGSE